MPRDMFAAEESIVSTRIQLTSINPAAPIWVNLDMGYYMKIVATGTAIHFGTAAIGQTVAVKESPRDILDAASGVRGPAYA
jgi:hypothetical protein